MENKKKKPLSKKLRSVYRISLLRESTFEEWFHIRLTPLNLIVVLVLSSLIMAVAIFTFIAVTPLRELLPGKVDEGIRSDASRARMVSDSLLRAVKANEAFFADMRTVMSGQLVGDSLAKPEMPDAAVIIPNFVSSPYLDDVLQVVSGEAGYRLEIVTGRPITGSAALMFKPVEGVVTNVFSTREGHYGIDVAAPENEVVKAVLDGTVIWADFAVEDGYVIHIQHFNKMVSLYKHNSVLLRSVGDKVRAGDPVAIIGNTGESSEGPHLHFELWEDGVALNPLNFLSYE